MTVCWARHALGTSDAQAVTIAESVLSTGTRVYTGADVGADVLVPGTGVTACRTRTVGFARMMPGAAERQITVAALYIDGSTEAAVPHHTIVRGCRAADEMCAPIDWPRDVVNCEYDGAASRAGLRSTRCIHQFVSCRT